MRTTKNSSFSIIFSLLIFLLLLPHSLSLSSPPPLPELPPEYADDQQQPQETYLSSSSSAPIYSIPARILGDPARGKWTLLHPSIGISAMHMQLLYNDHIIAFDRTDFGPSNLTLPFDKCPTTYPDQNNVIVPDCTAHSILYDVVTNTFRPLTVLTDTWCSSGSVDSTGRLVQTGGYALGERVIRTFNPSCSNDTCDWEELRTSLAARRWYASNHILPDGHMIVVGGRRSPNYEFFPNTGTPRKYPLRFLVDTWDGVNRENNLYPFLHLLPNGNLFIFANNRSIEFDPVAGNVVKEFPIMPLDVRRNYPSTGSSALLPILGERLEVLVCGGTRRDAFDFAFNRSVYVEASRSCGRMVITEEKPQWIMEEMPVPRVMGDMVVLPNGDVLIINGAKNGSAGWNNAANPVLHPVLYRVSEPDPGRRFVVLNPTKTPRMYHSAVVLVADGRVVVGGSNPNPTYNFTREARYPTELSLEAFHPPYLDPKFGALRPSILAIETEGKVVSYGQAVAVNFMLGEYRPEHGLAVTMLLPPFTTHSFGMNQRVLVLGAERVDRLSVDAFKVTVKIPENVNVAPPGYYMLFVVHAGVPSHGVWVQLKRTLI